MKAVNLIPLDERRGASRGVGSGTGAYAVIAALMLLVVLTGAFVMTDRTVAERRTELAGVRDAAERAQTHADRFAAYTRFAEMRARRVQTVAGLAASRFDWSHSLREVARVIPDDAWLTSMAGTVSPAVSLPGGGGGGGSGVRGALPVPAIEVSGCTTSQSSVARMLARMRLIDGVQRVSLASSSKAEGAAGGAGAGGAGGGGSDCRNGSDRFPQFSLVVFFRAPDAAAASAAPPAGAPAPAAATTPAPGGTR